MNCSFFKLFKTGICGRLFKGQKMFLITAIVKDKYILTLCHVEILPSMFLKGEEKTEKEKMR